MLKFFRRSLPTPLKVECPCLVAPTCRVTPRRRAASLERAQTSANAL